MSGESYPDLVASIVRDALQRQWAELERFITSVGACQGCRHAPIEVMWRSGPSFDEAGPSADGSGGMRVSITEWVRLLCTPCSDRLVATGGGTVTRLARLDR